MALHVDPESRVRRVEIPFGNRPSEIGEIFLLDAMFPRPGHVVRRALHLFDVRETLVERFPKAESGRELANDSRGHRALLPV